MIIDFIDYFINNFISVISALRYEIIYFLLYQCLQYYFLILSFLDYSLFHLFKIHTQGIENIRISVLKYFSYLPLFRVYS